MLDPEVRTWIDGKRDKLAVQDTRRLYMQNADGSEGYATMVDALDGAADHTVPATVAVRTAVEAVEAEVPSESVPLPIVKGGTGGATPYVTDPLDSSAIFVMHDAPNDRYDAAPMASLTSYLDTRYTSAEGAVTQADVDAKRDKVTASHTTDVVYTQKRDGSESYTPISDNMAYDTIESRYTVPTTKAVANGLSSKVDKITAQHDDAALYAQSGQGVDLHLILTQSLSIDTVDGNPTVPRTSIINDALSDKSSLSSPKNTIPQGADLNEYTTIGEYTFNLSAGVSTLANTPPGLNDAFKLTVYENIEGPYINQSIESFTGYYFAYRLYLKDTGTWYAWGVYTPSPSLPLSVENGGTGGSDKASALAALGALSRPAAYTLPVVQTVQPNNTEQWRAIVDDLYSDNAVRAPAIASAKAARTVDEKKLDKVAETLERQAAVIQNTDGTTDYRYIANDETEGSTYLATVRAVQSAAMKKQDALPTAVSTKSLTGLYGFSVDSKQTGLRLLTDSITGADTDLLNRKGVNASIESKLTDLSTLYVPQSAVSGSYEGATASQLLTRTAVAQAIATLPQNGANFGFLVVNAQSIGRDISSEWEPTTNINPDNLRPYLVIDRTSYYRLPFKVIFTPKKKGQLPSSTVIVSCSFSQLNAADVFTFYGVASSLVLNGGTFAGSSNNILISQVSPTAIAHTDMLYELNYQLYPPVIEQSTTEAATLEATVILDFSVYH